MVTNLHKIGLIWKSHGIFLIWVFTLRFLYEYIKEDQVAKEASMYLNIGQQLSIPVVLVGIFFLIRSYRIPLPVLEEERKAIQS